MNPKENHGRKLTLAEWAQLGEVIGMIAVVVSLLLVVYSINQNTQAIRGATDNMLFERHAELQQSIIEDESMAEILVKVSAGRELSEVESVRWWKYQGNLLDIWAMAHQRHEEGLVGDDEWGAWNTYFEDTFSRLPHKFSREAYMAYEPGFARSFWLHLGRAMGYGKNLD